MGHPIEQRVLHADLDTPVSAYLKLRGDHPWSFLFESVEGNEVWASYSIIGIGMRRTFVLQDDTLVVSSLDAANPGAEPQREEFPLNGSDPLTLLRREAQRNASTPPEGAPGFVGGIFGSIAYDAAHLFESNASQSAAIPGPSRGSDLCFVEPEVLAVFDNRRHSLTLYGASQQRLKEAVEQLNQPITATKQPRQAWSEPKALESRAAFEASVRAAKDYIRAGDVIQVVLSRRFELTPVATPFDVYRGLRTINPSPYLFFFATPDVQLAGASPEVMVRVADGHMTVRPIAGTRPRGANAEIDARLADELLADPKERAEHIMLVDLGRNDVGRVSQPGAVSVSSLMEVERYSHVMHIVSEVTGRLEPNYDAYDALRAAFPAGTLSGAPKVRAMQIISELEKRRRGVYGGAVGYFGPGGDADFGIAIRTLEAFNDHWLIQAGAGIVADSDPRTEAEETEHKARAVVRATQWAADRQQG